MHARAMKGKAYTAAHSGGMSACAWGEHWENCTQTPWSCGTGVLVMPCLSVRGWVGSRGPDDPSPVYVKLLRRRTTKSHKSVTTLHTELYCTVTVNGNARRCGDSAVAHAGALGSPWPCGHARLHTANNGSRTHCQVCSLRPCAVEEPKQRPHHTRWAAWGFRGTAYRTELVRARWMHGPAPAAEPANSGRPPFPRQPGRSCQLRRRWPCLS